MALATAPAWAQSVTPWSSADGVVTVSLPTGWTPIADASARTERQLAIAPGGVALNGETMRQCVVETRMLDLAPLSQAELNHRLDGITADIVLAGGYERLHGFSNDLINGVRVTRVDAEIRRGNFLFRHMQSVFQISTPAGARQYTVACGATDFENAADDIAAMSAFMQSLVINAGSQL